MAGATGAQGRQALGERGRAPAVGPAISAGSASSSLRGTASLARAASQGSNAVSTAGSSDGGRLHWAQEIPRTPSCWSPQSPSLRGLASPSSIGSSSSGPPAAAEAAPFLQSFQTSIRWGRPASEAGHREVGSLAAFTARAQAASVTVAKAFHAAKDELRSAVEAGSSSDAASQARRAKAPADGTGAAQQQLPAGPTFARQFSAELTRNRPEGSLRPHIGGIAGGAKVVDTENGMFFKIADDSEGVFQGISAMQGKPAKREASVCRWLCARYQESAGLMVSPSTVTDIIARNSGGDAVAVYRVMASLNLPVGEESLRLGSGDGGLTVHSCAAVAKRARVVADLCHVAPSRFQPSQGVVVDHSRVLVSAGRRLAPELPGDGRLFEWLDTLGASPRLYSTEGRCAELEALLGVRLDPLYHFTAKWETVKLPVPPPGFGDAPDIAAADGDQDDVDEALAAAMAAGFQGAAAAETTQAGAPRSSSSSGSNRCSSSRAASACSTGQLPLPFDVEVHGLPSGQLLLVDAHRLAIPEVPVVHWGLGVVVGVGPEGVYVSDAAAASELQPSALVKAAEEASRAHGGAEGLCLRGDDSAAGELARQCGSQLLCSPDGAPVALLPQPQKLWAAPFITALFPPGAGAVLRSLGGPAVSPDDVFTDDGKSAVAATAALLGPRNTAAAARAVLAAVQAAAAVLESGGDSSEGDAAMERILSLRGAVKQGLHLRGLGLRHVAFVHAAAARGDIEESALLDEALVCACLPRPGSCAGVALERLAALGDGDWPVAVIAARAVASKGRTTSARDAASLARLVVRHAGLCRTWLALQRQRGSSAFLRPATGAGLGGDGLAGAAAQGGDGLLSDAGPTGGPDHLDALETGATDDSEGGFVFATATDDSVAEARAADAEVAGAASAPHAPTTPGPVRGRGATASSPLHGTPSLGGDFSAAVRTAARELRWCQALVTEELELVLPLQQLLLAAVESGAAELSALVALQLLVLLWKYTAQGSDERISEAVAIGETVGKADRRLGDAIVSAARAAR